MAKSIKELSAISSDSTEGLNQDALFHVMPQKIK
jgi:hypothetical protein